jgi:hypothetical protein
MVLALKAKDLGPAAVTAPVQAAETSGGVGDVVVALTSVLDDAFRQKTNWPPWKRKKKFFRKN